MLNGRIRNAGEEGGNVWQYRYWLKSDETASEQPISNEQTLECLDSLSSMLGFSMECFQMFN